ncbi:DNA transfer protein p32 [Martelella sp. FLE1502]
MVATAIVGSAVVGAGASMAASSKQAKATDKASDQQLAMYSQTREDLYPYRNLGEYGKNMLSAQIDSLSSPIVMDQATLEKTPGYQFNLYQGLKSTQNSAAARGLGSSGAALKGAAAYATGLADSTYQNQFNNALVNKQNAYNMLTGITNIGQNAAAQTGSFGTQTAQSVGQNTIAGGTAQAAGMVGAANSLGNGVSNYLTWNAMKQSPQSNAPRFSSGLY